MRQIDTRPLRRRPPRGSVVRWQRAVQRAVLERGAPVTVGTRTSPSASVSRWRELRVRLWWVPLAVLVAAGIGIIVSEGDWQNLVFTLLSVAVLGTLTVLAVRWLQRRATPEWVRAYQLTAFAEANGLTSRVGVPPHDRAGRIFNQGPPAQRHRRDVVVWQQNGFDVETGTESWGAGSADAGGAGAGGRCRFVAVRLGTAAPFSPAPLQHAVTSGHWEVEQVGDWLNLYAPQADALDEEHWRSTIALVRAVVGPNL